MFLALNQSEAGLPAAVSVPEGVPELATGDADDVQLVAERGAGDGGERTGIVVLMALDEAEGWLLAAIDIADGVPQLTTGDADEMKLAVDEC